jgi:hypothetical protein
MYTAGKVCLFVSPSSEDGWCHVLYWGHFPKLRGRKVASLRWWIQDLGKEGARVPCPLWWMPIVTENCPWVAIISRIACGIPNLTKKNPCTTPPLTPKYSNPRPCTTPQLTPTSKRFEPKTMHYTTIDHPKFRTHVHALHHHWPQKDKDSNPDHALHHHWFPLRQRFEPQIIRTASRMKYNSCVGSVSLCRITYRPDYTKWWRHTQNR